jgi:membrane protein implicated in regulation of membrane protease activity
MTPLAWLGILAILLVIEAITVGLTTVWFAGGALVACIGSAGELLYSSFYFSEFPWCF